MANGTRSRKFKNITWQKTLTTKVRHIGNRKFSRRKSVFWISLNCKHVIFHCDVRRGVYEQILIRKKKQPRYKNKRDKSRFTNRILQQNKSNKLKKLYIYRLFQRTNLLIRENERNILTNDANLQKIDVTVKMNFL